MQGYRNGYASAISKAKVFTRIGNVAGGIGLAVSGYDMYENGINAQNMTDMIIGVASFTPGFGWIIGGAYLVDNMVSESINGKSLVENITGEDYD